MSERTDEPRSSAPPDEVVLGAAGRIARAFLDSKLTPLLVVGALLLGAFAVAVTPREEEPQISVPMIDVFAGLPGASAAEVEQRVTVPLEKAIYEIEGVEYVYSTSQPSGSLVIARFLVGTDRDQALHRVQAKVAETAPLLPANAVPPQVVARSIDDVPVVAYTLVADPDSSGPTITPLELRRVADELRLELARHPLVAQVWALGGQHRAINIRLDRERLAAHSVSPLQVYQALAGHNWRLPAGTFAEDDRVIEVGIGSLFASAEEVGAAIVSRPGGTPIYVRDVATVADGPEEPDRYVWLMAGRAAEAIGLTPRIDGPAVTLAVAKKPGTNAVDLVEELDRRIRGDYRGRIVPSGVEVVKTRDYGYTADEKSSELIKHLWIATIAVVVLMAFALGRREAVVVLVAVPTTLALTLASSYLFGYTLNRVTLFALIFAIGILVDDAIVVVENIHRHYQLGKEDPRTATVRATDEVGNPTILATFTVVAALLPLAFVSGLMGPYMRPIPINASAAMVFSLLVAFVVSPWLTYRLFRRHLTEIAGTSESGTAANRIERLYERLFRWLLPSAWRRWGLLVAVALLLLLSLSLVMLRVVDLKMLPFDNKSEVQVVLDMPEGTTLERTAGVARALAERARQIPEVTDIEVYAGTSAPFNFNGLVRHYFLREGPQVADLQINLLPKHERDRASHPFALDLREVLLPVLDEVGAQGASLKVTEVPPGPPVLSTLVVEIYGPDLERRAALASQVRALLEEAPGVVDVDTLVEERAPRLELEVDRGKAARFGISSEQIARTLRLALGGAEVGLLHDEHAREPVPLLLRLERSQRSGREDLLALRLHGAEGMVALGELVRVHEVGRDRFRYHKNLQPVSYVLAEVAGEAESPVYAMLDLQDQAEALIGPGGETVDVLWTTQPDDTTAYALKWDGEWQITYEVFRDMGIAFAVVLVLIYVLVVGWFRSFVVPIIIMVPIPLTLIGILPAHGLAGVFFTATSMIGFIALAGIIVRNSILLVDFINLELEQGRPLEEAVLRAGQVRFRPIALTAAALVVGGSVILLDPIFQGLAVALISGVVVSTALTLVVIPLLYYMVLRRRPSVEEVTAPPL